jgi:XrtJ-associated TM-motif-TM protein
LTSLSMAVNPLAFGVSMPSQRPAIRNSTYVYACAAIFFAIALPLWAQTGCVDSPEDPTAVLALAGGAGALISVAWARTKAQRNSAN